MNSLSLCRVRTSSAFDWQFFARHSTIKCALELSSAFRRLFFSLSGRLCVRRQMFDGGKPTTKRDTGKYLICQFNFCNGNENMGNMIDPRCLLVEYHFSGEKQTLELLSLWQCDWYQIYACVFGLLLSTKIDAIAMTRIDKARTCVLCRSTLLIQFIPMTIVRSRGTARP